MHRCAFGLQLPEQLPPAQTFEHAAPSCQVPVASQVCGVRPLHCFVEGVHWPVQAPARQTWPVQGLAAPHWPVALHSCTPLPEHCV